MIPPNVRAILDALAFDGRPADLSAIDFAFADRAQLTLLLSRQVQNPHIDSALRRNTDRVAKVAREYAEIEPLFDHVVLKGFTHVPDFIDDLRLRVQYDLDLYVPPSEAENAREALAALGYQPIQGTESLAMDHLPAMARKTGWEWRGDFFDPEIPTSIEVHFQFWDTPTEHLRAEALDEFWSRRESHQLALSDKVGYAALHLTRHLLRGNVRVFHVWELANFLNTHHAPEFWRDWQRLHAASTRRLESVAFLLAKRWFACRVPEAVEDSIDRLSPSIHRWFEIYGWSPIEGTFEPNKDELWLHMALLDSGYDRFEVLRRRLIPMSPPGPVDAVYTPADQLTPARKIKRAARNFTYAASRAFHHLRLFIPTVWQGIRWWFHSRS
jgi:hypothetical protein